MKTFRLLFSTLLLLGAASAHARDTEFSGGSDNRLPERLLGALGGDTLPLASLLQAELLGCFEISDDGADRVDPSLRGAP